MTRPWPLLRPFPFATLAFVASLGGAALSVPASQPRSLYAAPPRTAAAEASEPASATAATAAAAAAETPAPTAAMEEKFRKLQKEMQGSPAANPSPGASGSAPREGVSVGGVFLQILFGLAFVILLAVVSIRGLKRMQGKLLARPGSGGGNLLEVMETCYLGPHQKVIALRMNDEVGVLGVTKEGISLLTVLKQPAGEIGQSRRNESNPAAFSDNLNKLLDRFKKPKRVSDLLDEAQA
jgi:flagellar biogenesis protein FliO